MEPKGGKEKEDLVVNINNRAGATEDDIKHAKKSVEIVWNNLIGKDMVVNVEFVNNITDDEGNIRDSAGAYNPDTDKILIALSSNSFKTFVKGCGSQEAAVALITAHEMGHRFQLLRDGKVEHQPDTDSDEYINGTQEAEAWDIALHTFKSNWYEASGSFEYKGKVFTIPEKSKFD